MTTTDERGWAWHHGFNDRAYGPFSTYEEALQDATDTLHGGVTITIGRCRTFKASDFADFSATLESMGEAAYDEVREPAEEWPDAGAEANRDFERMLKDAVDAWADKHDQQPKFWQMEDEQQVALPEVTP